MLCCCCLFSFTGKREREREVSIIAPLYANFFSPIFSAGIFDWANNLQCKIRFKRKWGISHKFAVFIFHFCLVANSCFVLHTAHTFKSQSEVMWMTILSEESQRWYKRKYSKTIVIGSIDEMTMSEKNCVSIAATWTKRIVINVSVVLGNEPKLLLVYYIACVNC